MGNEIWKPIIMEEYDFSKFYLISNYGRVCSLRTHNGFIWVKSSEYSPKKEEE